MHTFPTQTSFDTIKELRMSRGCGYTINSQRVHISIGEIANDRGPEDLSGTLSIELWALDSAYTGHGFTGIPLAGTRIGELRGQHYLADCEYDLNFREPPAGNWSLCLMLREWRGDAYQTRDFVNFPVSYHQVEARADAAQHATANVISVAFPRDPERHTSSAGNPTAKTTKVALTGAPAAETTATTANAGAAQATPSPVAPTAATAKRARQESGGKVDARKRGLAVNHVSMEELAALKGVSRGVAARIVSARPFASWEDMLPVKGVGKKLLASIRSALSD